MIPALAGKKVAVYGLAKSGLAAIRLCQREGAEVTAVDKATRAQLGERAESLEQQGVSLQLGNDAGAVLQSADLIVVSPGVPLALPELQAATRAGVPVWGEVELASRFLPKGAPFIGITGTNGKSTTTALCGALFAAGQRRPFVGGNLGLPLSDAAMVAGEHDAFVIELSSFQLEGAQTLRCTGAALLNLTPDHIDRYESHAAYGEAKARIFSNQQKGDFAVVNADDEAVRGLAKRAKVPVYGFTLRADLTHAERDVAFAGSAVAEAAGFVLTLEAGRAERYQIENRALRGAHNLQNAMAAALLARRSGIASDAIQRGLDSYPGLPHRIESVATVDGVEWINDSKATNVDSSLVALNAFTSGVWLILGGKGKGAPYAPLVDASRGKVNGILTVGQDAETIAAAFEGVLPVHPCETLEKAVATARELAKAGDVVLLSPACASLDQFKSFEHRGDVFKALVKGMNE